MKNYELITRELSWYRLALSYFEEHQHYGIGVNGVCRALVFSNINLRAFCQEEGVVTRELMPSLYSLRTVMGDWWFGTRQERMDALHKAIELCIKRRELIWLKMALGVMKGGGCFAEGVCTILYDLGVKFKDFYVKGEHVNSSLLPTLHSVRTCGEYSTYWFVSDTDRLIGLEKAIATLEKEVGGVILPKQ